MNSTRNSNGSCSIYYNHHQTPIYGVNPEASYDPSIDLLYEEDADDPTIKRAAVHARLDAMTEKLPMILFPSEARL